MKTPLRSQQPLRSRAGSARQSPAGSVLRSISAGLPFLVLLAVASCAAPARPAPATSTELDLKKREIHDLWMQIREWRTKIDLPGVEPGRPLSMASLQVSIPKMRQSVCELPAEPAPACVDICDIGEYICENAERICAIADELPGDTWAEEKCASARGSCKEATQRCCKCESRNAERPPAPAPPPDDQ